MKKFTLLLAAAFVGLSASAADWFISGQFQGWSHCNANYKFTEVEAGVYSVDINQTMSGEFLICQGTVGNPDWNNKIGGVTNMELDKEYTYVAGGNNFSVKGAIECSSVEFNTNTKKIVLKGKAAENEYSCVYLVGDFGTGWSEDLTTYPLNLKEGTTNTYEGTYTLSAATTYFKMKAGLFVYSTGGEDVAVELGKEYTAARTGNAYSIGAGEYTFTFVLEKNAETGVLTVTGKGGETPNPGPDPIVDYSTWYVNVIGPFNGWEDNGLNPVDGVSTHDNLVIGTDGFKVKVWDGSKATYFVSDGNEIPVDQWTQLYEDAYDSNPVQIAGATATSMYNVKFNCANNQVLVTPVESGIEDITVADEAAEYFNLQGVRVENPRNGLFIRVSGNKATKVIVR